MQASPQLKPTAGWLRFPIDHSLYSKKPTAWRSRDQLIRSCTRQLVAEAARMAFARPVICAKRIGEFNQQDNSKVNRP